MRPLLLVSLAIAATLAVACDDHASQTTTTAAPVSGTTAAEDLKQAGRELGSAATKAASRAGRAAADEARREAKDLDVKVTTSLDGGR